MTVLKIQTFKVRSNKTKIGNLMIFVSKIKYLHIFPSLNKFRDEI